MADKRKNGGNGSFYLLTPELVCLFSFLTQTYNGLLQQANPINGTFSMLNWWGISVNPLQARVLTKKENDAQP